MTDLTTLHTAKIAVGSAQRELERTLKAMFPRGAPVMWDKGNNKLQSGTVDGHRFGDRLRVINSKTGAMQCVAAWDILRAGGLE